MVGNATHCCFLRCSVTRPGIHSDFARYGSPSAAKNALGRAQRMDSGTSGGHAGGDRIPARISAGARDRGQFQGHLHGDGPRGERRTGSSSGRPPRSVFWPHVEQEYRDEIAGIVEGLKARGVKLDVWDMVALNAWLEMPYYDKWHDKSTADRNGRGSGRPLQRLRRDRQLHKRRKHRHRAQQLVQLLDGRAVDHHLRYQAREGPPHAHGRMRRD